MMGPRFEEDGGVSRNGEEKEEEEEWEDGNEVRKDGECRQPGL